MRSANDVALELVAEDIGVPSLRSAGHRLPHPGKSLMPVESAQLDDFAIQLEAVIGELCFAESETARVFVDDLVVSQQTNMNGVKISLLEAPELDVAQLLKMDCVFKRLWPRGGGRGDRLLVLGDNAIGVAKFYL